MKGDILLHKSYTGYIARIRILHDDKIATIIFFDSSRKRVNLNDYTYDNQKKVWKFT